MCIQISDPSVLIVQHLLKKNEPVMAGQDEDESLPEITGMFKSIHTLFWGRGHLQGISRQCLSSPITYLPIEGWFEGFSSNGQSFSLKVGSGKVVTCDTSCFSISQDTALKYVGQTRASPSTSEWSSNSHVSNA